MLTATSFMSAWMQKNKKLLLGVLLGLIVFCVYVFIFTAWFFAEEDFILVFRAAHIRTFLDFFKSCIHGTTHYYALNCVIPASATDTFFLPIYYRPIATAICYIQYYLFGLNAHSYFVFTVLIHAVVTSCLFALLTSFVASSTAFLFSLFFAFHPTLFNWFGKIDLQQHHVALLFAILSLMTFKRGIVSGKKVYVLCSYGLFFISILTRETFLILPILIFLVLRLFPVWHSGKISSFKSQIRVLIGFGVAVMVFLLLRKGANAAVFLLSGTMGLFFCLNGHESLITAAADFFKFLYNVFLWSMFFPWSTYLFFKKYHLVYVYNALRVFILVLLTSCFITSTKKKAVIFFLGCALAVCWPLVILPYGWSHRFFYEALPFYCGALAILLDSSVWKRSWFIFCGKLVFGGLMIANALFVIQDRKSSVRGNKCIVDAIQTLRTSSYEPLRQHPVVFINSEQRPNVPYLGTLHALQLYNICEATIANYEFYFLQIHQDVCALPTLLRVVPCDGGVRLISNDQRVMWIALDEHFLKPKPFFIKSINIHQKNAEGHIFDLSIMFERQYVDPTMQILIWSGKDNRFFVFSPFMA